eukprot:COSAG01_NODE_6700_length_3538_cov_2.277406_2_plen_80_part_00
MTIVVRNSPRLQELALSYGTSSSKYVTSSYYYEGTVLLLVVAVPVQLYYGTGSVSCTRVPVAASHTYSSGLQLYSSASM